MQNQNGECMINNQGKFKEIMGFAEWQHISVIAKGYSDDEKYKVVTLAGEELLLRIADISQHEKKKKEYEIISKVAQVGFEMSFPKGFGTCNGGQNVYMLLSWVSGEDLEEALPKLSKEEQYRLGREAGRILKSMHSIPVEPQDMPSNTKKEKKMKQLMRYENSTVRIANDEVALAYVKANIDKIWGEKPVYLHGDFHPGNLILTPKHTIGVIDFNRWEVGDPYEEFYKLQSFGVEQSIPYCIGQIDAYFEDDVPENFWEVLAVYVAHASLYSIKWAEKFGQEEIDGMVKRCEEAFSHYDGFKKIIPDWYGNTYTI